MSHVYEMFCSSMIIFLSIKFYNHKNESKGLLIFISFFIFLAFYVRWINYYFFFIPLIMKLMFFSDSKFNLYKNKFFIFSSILNIFIFLSLSKSIYGLFTLNAADIYGLNLATSAIEKTITNSGYILMLLERIIIISFSQEFGIFWFQPIIFSVYFFQYINFDFSKNYKLVLVSCFIILANSFYSYFLGWYRIFFGWVFDVTNSTGGNFLLLFKK